jgi:hypothetical protein
MSALPVKHVGKYVQHSMDACSRTAATNQYRRTAVLLQQESSGPGVRTDIRVSASVLAHGGPKYATHAPSHRPTCLGNGNPTPRI